MTKAELEQRLAEAERIVARWRLLAEEVESAERSTQERIVALSGALEQLGLVRKFMEEG